MNPGCVSAAVLNPAVTVLVGRDSSRQVPMTSAKPLRRAPLAHGTVSGRSPAGPHGRRKLMRSGPDLREHNIGLVFDMSDSDHDGVITEPDLLAMGQRIINAFGITGPQRAEFLDNYRAMWRELCADCDSDGDGRITRQEYITAFSSGRGDPQAYFRELTVPIADAVERAVDQDGDGFITAEEYARLFAARDVDAECIRAGFARLDADGDGRITTGQLRDVGVQMFLSEDPADPGASCLGSS
jgi:Ca2+-binding EF-hand superfamily protein